VKEWKVILATLVLFSSGVVTGGLLVHLTSGKPARVRPVTMPGLVPPNVRDNVRPFTQERFDYIRRLTHQLELNPEQAAKIEKALSESQHRTKAVWESVQPRMNEELRKAREQIRDVLTPEQRQKFDEMNKQRPRKDGRFDQPMLRGPGEPMPVPPGGPRPGQPAPFRPEQPRNRNGTLSNPGAEPPRPATPDAAK